MSDSVNALSYFKRNGSAIFAAATAPGGPVAVLRISGNNLSVLTPLIGDMGMPGTFAYRVLRNPKNQNEKLDQALVLFFKAPHSFTGEDVIELHCHGTSGILENISDALLSIGVEQALPGEFSFRAVLNNKMSLGEAEKLNQLLKADSLGPLASSTLLTNTKIVNETSRRLEEALANVISARGRVEAAIDFPEAEEEQATEVHGAKELILKAKTSLEKLRTTYEVFAQGSVEPTVLIMGAPNAGKSTLLNKLVGGERSIVSATAGTTRDYVDARLRLPSGRRIRLIDTAGLREIADSGEHAQIESRGMDAAFALLQGAALVIWVEDLRSVKKPSNISKLLDSRLANKALLRIASHADQASASEMSSFVGSSYDLAHLSSAEESQILALIEQQLGLDLAHKIDFEEGLLSERQYRLIELAIAEVSKCLRGLEGIDPIEIVGEHIYGAERELKRALGRELGEDYLGAIFTQFCLGK